MSKVLGLDIGANSIGWALIDDEENDIIGAGVRVFKEGVNLKGVKEESKNVERRAARLARRQHKRRSQRRNRLVALLKTLEMFPENNEDISDYYAQDPYELRKKGLYEKLTMYEFGRVLLHICRRRGFKSSRKTDISEEGKIFEGKDGIVGINQTRDSIREGGFKTIGEYLASLDPHVIRRRNRFTLRDMYEEEFNLMWEKQQSFYPLQLSNEFKEAIAEVILSQRKLKSQKALVGNCGLEPNKKTAPKSSPAFQYFRILEQLSRILISIPHTGRYNDPLNEEERRMLIDKLSVTEKLKFSDMRKMLNLPGESDINIEEEGGRLLGNTTYARLIKVFGKKRWAGFSEEEKEQIWHTFHFADNHEWLKEYALKKWSITPDEIKELGKVALEKEYARFSKKSLKKIIPQLEEGLTLDKAKIEAGYTPEYEIEKSLSAYLPLPENIRNPIVQQALYELRHVVNAVIRTYGKPDIARVELAREMKKPKQKREKMRSELRKRQMKFEEIKSILKERLGFIDPKRDEIHKYMLWEECRETCPYTGRKISLSALYGGDFEVEHIIPYKRSLDDSLFNKTVCLREENQIKGDRTPYEAYSGDRQKYEEIILRVQKTSMPRGKKNLFAIKELKDDFAHRQLSDTAYISRETRKYLGSTIKKVQAVKGGSTAKLRYYWGLNSILGVRDIKMRDDHRHHAVDALVIANTTYAFVNTLSRYHSMDVEPHESRFPLPWEQFRNDAESVVRNIFVSHRLGKKATGQLHEETYYGKIRNTDGEPYFVVRKKLGTLTAKQIANIVDPVVKTQVFERLEEKGIDIESSNKIPADAFVETLYMPDRKTPIKSVRVKVPSTTMIQLYKDKELYVDPGSNHHIVIFENEEGKRDGIVVSLFEAAQRLRRNEPVIQKTWKPEWHFVMSLSIDELILLDVDEKNIDWGDTGLALRYSKALYRVQKMDVNKIITLRHHLVARLKDDEGKEFGREHRIPSTLRGLKVKIDHIGRLRRAYD
ncbi:hypothetical protein AMJ80_10515 [bacterium SM23_31]|nr:MAG: hypothetical protein AMJ80_10515 [bacterium SM23_31]